MKNPPPFVFDWVEYKGDTMFAEVDYIKSEKCNRPIINLFYCATRALNNMVIKSVNYNPDHFKKSRLSGESWNI